jgi:N-acetylneuraminate synthase
MSRPPRFVAEISSNHNRDLDRCFAFIEEAARIQCDAVKFQLFRVDELFAPEVLQRSEKHASRREWELPREFIPRIAERCRQASLEFSCTPFYLDAVGELQDHVSFYKIASYELLWDALLVRCASAGKPIVLSTGMATLPEIQHAVEVLRGAGCVDLTLLHCISDYPAAIDASNLAAIETLRSICGCSVGWSDHTVSPAVIHRAVHRFGASLIEFNFDLDGEGREFGLRHCWCPEEIAPVIRAVRQGLLADGDGEKRPHVSEERERNWRTDPLDGLRPLLCVRDEWRTP